MARSRKILLKTDDTMPIINFHYFHDDEHIPCQGSFSKSQFDKILDNIQKDYTLISPHQCLERLEKGIFTDEYAAISFDCGLKSQFDIARPVLNERGVTAFWFLYTLSLKEPVKIEKYHHFRFYCYKSIEDFYNEYIAVVNTLYGIETIAAAENEILETNFLGWSSYYTSQDKLYKYLRDHVLGCQRHDAVMARLIKNKKYNINEHKAKLFLTRENIETLYSTGNVIGLHTHTHPNDIGSMSPADQRIEYQTNKEILESIITEPVIVMSHPCNSYNDSTIQVLKDLGIKFGFRSNYDGIVRGLYEIPRINSTDFVRTMYYKR